MDKIINLDASDFSRSTFGTDNGPACTVKACAGTVYRYDIEPGEHPTLTAYCVGCGAETTMQAPATMPKDGTATFLRRWHERFVWSIVRGHGRVAVSHAL